MLLTSPPISERGCQSTQWTQLAVHWPPLASPQVLTLIWGRGGARNLFPTQNWLLSIPSWDIWKAPLMPESMQAPGSNDSDDKKPQILIIFTNSHIVTKSRSLLSSRPVEDSEACRLGVEIRKMSQLVIWSRRSCTRGAKVASKLLRAYFWPPTSWMYKKPTLF